MYSDMMGINKRPYQKGGCKTCQLSSVSSLGAPILNVCNGLCMSLHRVVHIHSINLSCRACGSIFTVHCRGNVMGYPCAVGHWWRDVIKKEQMSEEINPYLPWLRRWLVLGQFQWGWRDSLGPRCILVDIMYIKRGRGKCQEMPTLLV